jgi:hypothetical protein
MRREYAIRETVFDQVQVNPIPQESPTGQLALDDTGKPFLLVQERAGGHRVLYVVAKP